MKEKHIHRYRRVMMGKKKDFPVYQCQEPNCTSYVRPELLVGKLARCIFCRETFIVTAEQMRILQMKLHCPNCTGKGASPVKVKRNVEPSVVETFLENFGLGKED